VPATLASLYVNNTLLEKDFQESERLRHTFVLPSSSS
jgi:hypothetical protein